MKLAAVPKVAAKPFKTAPDSGAEKVMPAVASGTPAKKRKGAAGAMLKFGLAPKA